MTVSNWQKEMEARAHAAADELVGTCKSLHEVCPGGEQDDLTFCETLDSLVYECVCCNWWFEAGDGQHDKQGGWACDDCNEEE
jgi:hypothetical protein